MIPAMRRILATSLFALGAALLAVPLLTVQLRPALPEQPLPDAASAARTRDLAEGLRATLVAQAEQGEIMLPLDQIRAVIASLRRVEPGIRARAEVEGERLVLSAAIGAPRLPAPFWLNPSLEIAASETGLVIESARLGYLPLPPALVRLGLGAALDQMLGPGLGEVALGAVSGLSVRPEAIKLRYALDPEERDWFYTELKNRVRGLAGGTDAGRIYTHLWYLDRRGDRGELPRQGSVLPYLRYVLAQRGDAEEIKAALLALTLYCGEDAFGPAIGAGLAEEMRGDRNHCEQTTLGNRDDLKRHFIISAGLYAARSGQAAFGMGELKELLDSNAGGSGFSFDDMAADLAGARFAEVLLRTPEGERAGLLARVNGEADVMPPIDGLPRGLPDAEFRARFGALDSPAYRAMITEISRRIDEMPLYEGVSSGD